MPTFSAPGADQYEMRGGEPAPSIWASFWGLPTTGGWNATSAYRYSLENHIAIEMDGVFTAADADGRPTAGTVTAVRYYIFAGDDYPDGRQLLYEITNASFDAALFYVASQHQTPLAAFLMAGDDLLVGSVGQDNLVGGNGDDTYLVNHMFDWTWEEAGADSGYDTVQSSVSYTLRSNVEHLILTGSLELGGTGNAGENLIEGNDGDNRLSGEGGHDTLIGGAGNDILLGGAGPDDLYGGMGDDRFQINDVDDTAADVAGGGYDIVRTRVDFSLGTHLERLDLLGQDDLNGAGNGQGNLILGNVGDNFLRGLNGNDVLQGGDGDDRLSGGRGDDRLSGGAGADLFLFNVANGFDRVMDFTDGDLLAFDSAIFASAEAVLAAMRETANGHTVIVNGGFKLLLIGVDPTDVTADDIAIYSSGELALSNPDWFG